MRRATQSCGLTHGTFISYRTGPLLHLLLLFFEDQSAVPVRGNQVEVENKGLFFLFLHRASHTTPTTIAVHRKSTSGRSDATHCHAYPCLCLSLPLSLSPSLSLARAPHHTHHKRCTQEVNLREERTATPIPVYASPSLSRAPSALESLLSPFKKSTGTTWFAQQQSINHSSRAHQAMPITTRCWLSSYCSKQHHALQSTYTSKPLALAASIALESGGERREKVRTCCTKLLPRAGQSLRPFPNSRRSSPSW